MRALYFIAHLTLIIIIIGCSEKDITNVIISQNDTIPILPFCIPEEPVQNPQTCIPEDKSTFYVDLWKQAFLARNNISESYFDKHISSIWTSSICWNSGISFQVNYRITIDWAVIDRSDKFIIMLYSSTNAYQYLNIPRDVFLDEYQIGRILDYNVFSSAVGPVVPLDRLSYENCMEAVQAFQDSVGSRDILPIRFAYYIPGKIPREDGYPYFIGQGDVDLNKNECIAGYFNLFSGESEAWLAACVVE